MFGHKKWILRSGLILSITLIASFILGVKATSALTENCFSDVNTGQWFHDYVCWMFDKGLTAGYPDGTFRPFNPITRAELSVFMKQISGEGTVGAIVNADRIDDLDSTDFAAVDHDHADLYYSETELQSSGSASVHWGNLTAVPADLTDGDDDTLAGLACSTDQIIKWNGTSWVCAVDNTASSAGGGEAGSFSSTTDSNGIVIETITFNTPFSSEPQVILYIILKTSAGSLKEGTSPIGTPTWITSGGEYTGFSITVTEPGDGSLIASKPVYISYLAVETR